MDYFPIFMNVEGRTCLVVGGGGVAARKVDMLLRAGARVVVVAPLLEAALAGLAARRGIIHRAACFAPEHLDGAVLAVAATDDLEVNTRVARHARLRGVPVNVVDDPGQCSFIMPAVVDRSPVLVAVSTGGASPTLSRWVRSRIESVLPTGLGNLATLAGRYRDAVRRLIPDIADRRRFWRTLVDGPVAELSFARRDGEAEAALQGALHREEGGPHGNEGVVYLVGAGPGDPDLLTVRALRLIESADVIVHDSLVTDEILDFARRDAERIPVGKRRGRHTMAQHDINDLLIRLAGAGRRVIRLKGGDPFVFGRGGEEMEAVAAAGIACHAVPGITAATGCAAYAGIPLTHRDHASQCVFVTGHGKDGDPDLDWPDLDWDGLARSAQTVVIYMGLNTLGRTASRMIAHGLPATTPAAVIDKGTTPDERVIIGTLADLAARAEAAGIEGPALIIVGDVVALARRERRVADLAVAV